MPADPPAEAQGAGEHPTECPHECPLCGGHYPFSLESYELGRLDGRREHAALVAERDHLQKQLQTANEDGARWWSERKQAEAERDRYRTAADAYREALAWALEEGGWRLIHYADPPYPTAIAPSPGGMGARIRTPEEIAALAPGGGGA